MKLWTICALALINYPQDLIAQVSSSEQNCVEATVDMENFPKNRFNGPTIDSLGWCFAHAAADILSFHFQSPLSVHSIAAAYFDSELYLEKSDQSKNRIVKHLSGGHVLHALMANDNQNICYEKDADFYGGNWRTQAQKMLEISSYKAINRSTCRNGPDDIIENFKDIVGHLPPEKRLKNIFDKTCREKGLHFRYSDLQNRIRRWGLSVQEDIRDYKVDPTQNQNNISEAVIGAKKPVAVGFDFSMLLQDQTGLHAATLVGQRKSGSRCEYVIRNNSGVMCKEKKYKLRPGVSCDESSDLFFVERTRANGMILNAAWIN